MKTKWIFSMVTVLALGSCTEYDRQAMTGDAEARVRLTTSISPFEGEDDGEEHAATRAQEATGSEAWLRRSQLQAKDQFQLVFPDGHGGYKPMSDGGTQNYYPTADGSGGVYVGNGTEEVTGSMIYLNAGQVEGTVRGYYPSSFNRSNWTVSKDQHNQEGYVASDLMLGTGAVVRHAGETVAAGTIDFRHAMAKIKVTVTAGSNVKKLFYVHLVSGYAKGTLKETDINKQQLVFAGDGTHESFDKSKYGEEITHGSPLKLFHKESTEAPDFTGGSTVTVSCLIPPQELAISDAFLEVSVQVLADTNHSGATGTTKTVVTRYRFASKQALEGGRCYTLSVEPAIDEGTADVTVKEFNAGSEPASYGNSISVSAPDTYYLATDVSIKMVPVLREGYSYGTGFVDDDLENYTTLRGETVNGQLGPYYIGQVEVTEGVWNAVMGTSGYTKGKDYPKTNITWNEICSAGGFLDKLNSITEDQRPGGFRFELPTEAQWEYAAKGGLHGDDSYLWGGSTDSGGVTEVAWYSGNSSNSLHEVGKKNASNLGLYDMSGNASEILADWYETTVDTDRGKDYIHMPDASATGNVMAAGGDYSSAVDNTQVSVRSNFAQTARDAKRGFRVVLRKVQIGDVYYSNGAYGTYWEHPTGTGRTPVGIVFKTGTTDYEKVRGFKGGNVMALKEVTDRNGDIIWTKWSDDMIVQTTSGDVNLNNIYVTDTHYDYVSGTGKEDQFVKVMSDYDGLKHCETARANAEKATSWTIDNLPAISAAFAYKELPTPTTSSGWYLPSIGQCYNWWVSMGKSFDEYSTFFPAETSTSNWSYGNYSYYISSTVARNVAGKMLKAINDFVNEKLGTAENKGYFTPLSETGAVWDYTYNADGSKHMQNEFRFWTSTENTEHVVWYLRFNINGGDRDIDVWCQPAVHKSSTSKMRPVLTF